MLVRCFENNEVCKAAMSSVEIQISVQNSPAFNLKQHQRYLIASFYFEAFIRLDK
jgi:hypothetical protein